MKGRIIYIEGHLESTKQAKQAKKTLEEFGWDVLLREGYTPETIGYAGQEYNVLPNGRLSCFEGRKFLTKKSCAMNHIRCWEETIISGTPQAFFEHDAIGIEQPNFDLIQDKVKEFCFLSMDYAFDWGALAGKFQWRPSKPKQHEIRNFPEDYPLRHHRLCMYKGALLPPGVAAYVVTPRGAEKLLEATAKYGLEQADYLVNSHNVLMQYYAPSVCKYNKVNLNTS